jgi:hypothetical protein
LFTTKEKLKMSGVDCLPLFIAGMSSHAIDFGFCIFEVVINFLELIFIIFLIKIVMLLKFIHEFSKGINMNRRGVFSFLESQLDIIDFLDNSKVILVLLPAAFRQTIGLCSHVGTGRFTRVEGLELLCAFLMHSLN